MGLLAQAACTVTDIERPIGVIADGLTADDEANLEQAAECWNLRLGVQFVVGAEAASLGQQVEVFYDDLTCLHAVGQVQAGWPTRIGLCPEKYWGSELGFDPDQDVYPLTAFRVLSHELGHVLNIVGHPDDAPFAVMDQGGGSFGDMFAQTDIEAFAEANPGFEPVASCRRVVRSIEPGTGGRISRCACDNGPFDLTRPIAIVSAEEMSPETVSRLTAAAGCWNLRYGTSVVVRAPETGDQIAYFEPTASPECGASLVHRPFDVLHRAQDGDDAVLCGPNFNLWSPLQHVGRVLAVPNRIGIGSDVFSPDHAEFAKVYPGRAIACQDVRIDPFTQTCTCADVRPTPR